MAVDDRDVAGLLADLWDLVEGWSSGAIQRTREAPADASPDVTEAEIRLLVAHAAELRGVLEAHLLRAEPEPESEPGLEPEPESEPEPEPEPESDRAATQVSEHSCNSADFDRPPCEQCHGRHWYCSICGTRRDDCPAA